MRHVICAALLSASVLACSAPVPVEAPETYSPGIYTGWFALELTATFGLWESETEGCDADLTLIIEPDHDVAPIRGRVYCETPTLGGNLLDIKGSLETFPTLSGALSSAERSDAWEGTFIDEDCLTAQLSGAVEQNGVTVDYVGAFTAWLDPEAEAPGATPPTEDDGAPADEPSPSQ